MMRKIKVTLLSVILQICILNVLPAYEITYNITTGNDKLINNLIKDKYEKGYVYTSDIMRNNEIICHYQIFTDSNSATVRFILNDMENRINLYAIRTGNMITITGNKADKEVNLRIKIDKRPWLQIFPDIPYGLDQFTASENKKIKFWTISPDILKEVLLRAEKKSEEDMNIMGNMEKAVKVHITINGIGSIFWGEDYYFRKTDGQFVYMEGALKTKENKTIVELIGKK